MKTSTCILPFIIVILFFACFAGWNIARAQDTNTLSDFEVELQALEATTPMPASELPDASQWHGFYSAQNPENAPMPADVLGLDFWPLGEGFYVVNDTNVDYAALAQPQTVSRRTVKGLGTLAESDGLSADLVIFGAGNGLWLEITNVAAGLAGLNLHNATNQVYAIWSATNLATPLADWQVEREVWPDDTNLTSFTVDTAGRDTLFLRAEDWTSVDSDGDGIPDWWIWLYYGNLSETATDLDANGNTLGYDYANNLAPATFQFLSMAATNNHVNSLSAPVQLNVTGNPYYIAVSVDDTNYANDADWQPYTGSHVNVNLGMTEGWHDVRIGLKGHAANAPVTWQWKRLKLDMTPPQIVVTNPVSSTVDRPLIQLQGYSPEELSSISYDLTNASGLATNQQILILDQSYSTNTWEFTTNVFQGFDIPLANGLNILTLHATDMAGNVTTTNFNFTVDYSGKTNPPDFQITWPPVGESVCGDAFTLRGQVADPTVTVTAQMVDTNGLTNMFFGEVERNGRCWLENLPLSAGTNLFTLTVADAASNVWTTNLTVVQSAMTLAMNPVSDPSQLWQATVSVSGVISDPTATVSVNGVPGTNHGDGTWSAENVPVSPDGVAIFDMNATPAGGGDPAASLNADKPTRLYVKNYSESDDTQNQSEYDDSDVGGNFIESGTDNLNSHDDLHWTDGSGGGGSQSAQDDWTDQTPAMSTNGSSSWQTHQSWPASSWPDLPFGTQTGDGDITNTPDWDTVILPPSIIMEHCDITVPGDNQWQDYNYPGTDVYEDGDYSGTYKRTADAVMKLQTGGKATVSRQNLWRLSATATQYTPMNIGESALEIGYDSQTMDPQNITVDGQTLNAGGYTYKILPDNTEVDVTPKAGADYYTFDVSAQKYLSHLEVFVNQPDPTGNVTWTPFDNAGHAWWCISTEAPQDAINQFNTGNVNLEYLGVQVGYGPASSIIWQLPWKVGTAPGKFPYPYSNSDTTNAIYQIDFMKVFAGLNYEENLKANQGTYSIPDNTCVTKTIGAGGAVGIELPLDETPENFGKGLPPSN